MAKRPAQQRASRRPLGRPAKESAPTERSIEASVGGQIRQLRQELGITSKELAGLAGLSVSALSKIENGRISPSLSALKALANALNAPIGALFSDFDEKSDCSFVPAGKGMRMERRGTREGHEYDLLGQSVSGAIAFEPYLITLRKGSQPYTGFRHAGLEFIYLLEGNLTYRHASHSYEMGPGDALLFDSSSSHGPESLSRTRCKYLSIIVHAR